MSLYDFNESNWGELNSRNSSQYERVNLKDSGLKVCFKMGTWNTFSIYLSPSNLPPWQCLYGGPVANKNKKSSKMLFSAKFILEEQKGDLGLFLHVFTMSLAKYKSIAPLIRKLILRTQNPCYLSFREGPCLEYNGGSTLIECQDHEIQHGLVFGYNPCKLGRYY